LVSKKKHITSQETEVNFGDIDNITLPKEILFSAKVKVILMPKILSQNIVAHVMNP
jgi:hypothetical protein